MKNILKKLLDIPTPFALAAGVIAIVLAISIVDETLSMLSTMVIIGLAIFVALQIYLGSIVLKAVAATIVVVYMASIYTNIVMLSYGNVVEPFLLTIAAVTAFLALTYSSKNYTHGMRSRPLWSSIVTIVIVSTKMAFIISGYSFVIAEVIGLNLMVVIAALWILWIKTSKKTKIIEPNVDRSEVLEKFQFVYINNKLNVVEGSWVGAAKGKDNARPWIHNEALKANDKGLSLVIVSTLDTNKIYDVGEISLNKSKTIKYLYMEAKENYYVHDTMDSFVEELQRG